MKLTGDIIPDPALVVACRGSVTWSERCSEKLLPVYNDAAKIDSEQEELYEMAREWNEYDYGKSIRPPDSLEKLAAGLAGASSAATVVIPEKDGRTEGIAANGGIVILLVD